MAQPKNKHITMDDIPLDTHFNSLDELLDSQELTDFLELCDYLESKKS